MRGAARANKVITKEAETENEAQKGAGSYMMREIK